MKPLALSLFLSASALAVALPSRAQPEASADSTSVRADYRKALAEMDKGNWQSARVLLIDLFKRSPTFDVAASLGETESKLGENANAAQHFAFALKNIPPKEKAETTTRIRAGLSSVTGNVATIRLSANRQPAQFFVDGEEIGSYPALSELYLSPGKHTLEARAGSESEKRDVQAVAGTSNSMAFMLVAETLPSSGLATPPPHQAEPTPPPAAASPSAPTADSESSARPIALVTGGSLAVVGLALGIGFGVAAKSAEDDANKYRSGFPSTACSSGSTMADCKSLDDALSRQSRDSTIANVGWALGAVGAVTVGVALLWPRDEGEKKPASARGLSLGLQGNRFLLRGTF